MMARSPRAPTYEAVYPHKKKNFFTALRDLREKRRAKRAKRFPTGRSAMESTHEVGNAVDIATVPGPDYPTLRQRLERDIANGVTTTEVASRVLNAVDAAKRGPQRW